jgi:hypothetical protein
VGISATQATRIDVTATDGTTSNTVSQEIVWTPTDLKGNIDSSKTVTVRKGDSLLLTDTEDGTALWIDTKAGGTPATFGGLPGSHFACKFDATGTFTITATVTKADNSTVKHYLLVKVLSVNLDGPIACEVGYQREKGVDIFGGVNADVSFSTNDSYLMDVSVKQATTYGSRLFLKTKKRGTPILLARLPGVNGPLLAMQEVDEFTLETSLKQYVMIDTSTGSGFGKVVVRPYIANLDFQFAMFAHTSTFTNGATTKTVNTHTFQQIIDSTTGDTLGEMNLEIEIPPNEDSYCFNLSIGQHSSHGTETGWVQINGKKGEFRIKDIQAKPDNPLAINDEYKSQKEPIEALKNWKIKYIGETKGPVPAAVKFRWERKTNAKDENYKSIGDGLILERKEALIGDFDVRLVAIEDNEEKTEYHTTQLHVVISDVTVVTFKLAVGGEYKKVNGIIARPLYGMIYTFQVNIAANAPPFTKFRTHFIQSLNKGSSVQLKATVDEFTWLETAQIGDVAKYPPTIEENGKTNETVNDTAKGQNFYGDKGYVDLGKEAWNYDVPLAMPPIVIELNDKPIATVSYKPDGPETANLRFTLWGIIALRDTKQIVPLKQQDWNLDIDGASAGPWKCTKIGEDKDANTKPPDNTTSSDGVFPITLGTPEVSKTKE